MNDHEFANELRGLAERITPDPAFVERLEQQLEETPMNTIRTRQFPVRSRWMMAAAALIVIISLFLTVPPLRTWAQEIIARLFYPAASDQQRIVYNEFDISTIPSVQTLEEAEALADELGFDVLTPLVLPEGMVLDTVRYTVDHPYMSMTFRKGDQMLVFYQMRPEQQEQDQWGMVGASAAIQEVAVTTSAGETITAQAVRGAWAWETPMGSPTPYPGQGVDTVMNWNSSIPMLRLRWEANEIVYEIDMIDLTPPQGDHMPFPTLDDLVAIAEGLR